MSLVDRRAYGGFAGADVCILERTGRNVLVTGIDDHELPGLDIVTCVALVYINHGKINGHCLWNCGGYMTWPRVTVEKLQFSLFLISCSQGILNASWLSWSLLLKISCLHVSFTAYENFYRLSKIYCHLVLTFHFPIFRMSECRNPTIKHIFTYTLISPFINTYVTDLFLVILFT